eukprot:6375795-Amphidinium_carterae.1
MWIACGRIPTSYMKNSNDSRHKYYNFHTEVHYAIIQTTSTSTSTTYLQSSRLLQQTSHNRITTWW